MALLTQKYRLDLVTKPISNASDLDISPLTLQFAQRPTPEEIISGLPLLTHETAVLGVCEDGVPLLLDLHNPSPGALLVIGHELTTPLNLLEVVHQSLWMANDPQFLQLFLVSDKAFSASHPVERWINPHHRDLEQTLIQLSDVTNARQQGKLRGPSIVLLIEDLEWVLRADPEAIWALEYLLHYGPNQKIWPIVATTLENETIRLRWLRRFKTLIWAADLSLETKQKFSLPTHPFSTTLPASSCFSLMSKGQWLHIWVPER
ncbi:MAG: hypothetical protein ACPLUL_05025 [Thermanaerothrix sp.]|uniref:hypothetical protein n=1 Tax=Thermanaerothrix sp. TaxID=2972675 RepID=UPI003C7D90D0